MARGRRRGPSLLIPMIVLILATLGVSYWAVTIVEDIELARQSLHSEQVAIYRVQVAEDQAKVRAEHATEFLGYRGAGSLATPQMISRDLSMFASRSYQFLEISFGDDGRKHVGEEERQIGDWENLVRLINRQDELIDLLLSSNALILEDIRSLQIEADDAYQTAEVEVDRRMTSRDRAIEDKIGDFNNPEPGSLLHEIRNLERKQQEMATADENMLQLYRQLWTTETRDAIADLREQRRRVQRLRQEISQELEELEQALADSIRARTQTEHYDGEIWFVDMERRWAYINLGQRDNVKPGMAFEVQRLQRAERPVPIGMVTVRQVIGDFMSWCEITLLQDDDVPMQVGDKVLSRNFARDLKPRFALVGQFGGAYSRFSRHETEEMLRNEGFQVDTVISRHTDAIVLGVGFREDSQFLRIHDGDLSDFSDTYQYWRPAEVYYMLGFED